jgi:hypothetical protein
MTGFFTFQYCRIGKNQSLNGDADRFFNETYVGAGFSV